MNSIRLVVQQQIAGTYTYKVIYPTRNNFGAVNILDRETMWGPITANELQAAKDREAQLKNEAAAAKVKEQEALDAARKAEEQKESDAKKAADEAFRKEEQLAGEVVSSDETMSSEAITEQLRQQAQSSVSSDATNVDLSQVAPATQRLQGETDQQFAERIFSGSDTAASNEQLTRESEGEGTEVYLDSELNQTIGIGFNIDPTNETYAIQTVQNSLGVSRSEAQNLVSSWRAGTPISESQQNSIFQSQYEQARREATAAVPNISQLSTGAQGALIDLYFNTGQPTASTFVNTLAAANEGNEQRFWEELLSSQREIQTRGRGSRFNR